MTLWPPSKAHDVTVPTVTLAHKVDPGVQDLQTRARRILAERNAEKAEENMWIGWMVAAESINDMKALIKSLQKCAMILLTTPEWAGNPVDCASLHCEVHA